MSVLVLGSIALSTADVRGQTDPSIRERTNAPALATKTNTPVAPTYSVHRIEVTGNTRFTPDAMQHILRQAMGTHVTLTHLRRALVSLQEAYRERGFSRVSITLPRQPLTNGVVRVQVVEHPNAQQSTPADLPALDAWTVPSYDIQHIEVHGNTVLAPGELGRLLAPLVGPRISEDQIQRVLAQLRAAYLERGLHRAAVTLPQQVLTDGTVAIRIDEGRSADPEPAALAPKAAPPAVAPRTFEVRHYDVVGNTLLRPEVIERAFTPALGTNVTLPQIQKALGELQLAYRERGFVTAAVGLPQQQLTNAVVRVQVTEGVLTDIRVTGNRWFSTNNILRNLPSLATNSILNGRVLQRELDRANQNPDRQIYPTIGPGPDPGTSALTLRVKDRLPLHGRLELNNHATPGTPDWRVNASLHHANLWQHEHQLGLSYGFTPERFKSGNQAQDAFFNRPLIANYGAYYRLPFGPASSVQDQISQSNGRFGYDEAARQFRLPPAGARPDLTAYVSASSSDTGTKLSDPEVVTQTPLLTIVSQDSGQNVSINEGAGLRLNVPLAPDDRRRIHFSGGFDARRYLLRGFNTNQFLITTVITNAQGSQTIESRVDSAQPAQRQELNYLPLALGLDYLQSDPRGTFSAALGLNVNLHGESSVTTSPTNTVNDRIHYGKATLSLVRDHRFFKDWSLVLRGSGQIASDALNSNEQLVLGGVNSVRGYYDGEAYGDAGWFAGVELRTPFIRAQAPTWSGTVPAWVRGSLFLEGGQQFQLDTSPGSAPDRSLLGAGVGLSANLNNRLDVRVLLAWPLRDGTHTRANDPRAYFSLGGQF